MSTTPDSLVVETAKMCISGVETTGEDITVKEAPPVQEAPPRRERDFTHHYVPSISRIESDLFLGNLASSFFYDTLFENGITAIVSVVVFRESIWNKVKNRQLVSDKRHLFVACKDSTTMDLLALMADICDFIDSQTNVAPHDQEEQETGTGRVLVHCQLGVSRSATVVIAYLMRRYHESLDEVLRMVRTKRKINPNPNFLDQLQVWQDTGYDIWEDKESKTPKEPYRAYLERRAVKLEALGLTGNEPIGFLNL